MIEIENCAVSGWEAAVRGMRNPKNSWGKSDSLYITDKLIIIGPNDKNLMTILRNAGTDHRKFMRMIIVYTDITAPLYWWKEFDTYKVGTIANSCSTMHKIQSKEFTIDDFSHEHLTMRGLESLRSTIYELEFWRGIYNDGGFVTSYNAFPVKYSPKDKKAWWQMIQLLPSSYNQKRTIMLNYEVLANMYESRKNHKLDEWNEFCKWIKSLPYSEIITGDKVEDNT